MQNPTVSLEGDVAATNAAIAKARHPVLLVGHSYGGMVITEAGNNPKVRRLAYIAAYAPTPASRSRRWRSSPLRLESRRPPCCRRRMATYSSTRRSSPRHSRPTSIRRRRTSWLRAGPVGSAGRGDRNHQGRVEDKAFALPGDDEGRHDSPDRSAHDGEAKWREDCGDRQQPRGDAVETAGSRELHQGRGYAGEIGDHDLRGHDIRGAQFVRPRALVTSLAAWRKRA